jgi:predicted AlkP superfamily pyrophosphatase or phosphodiesterase
LAFYEATLFVLWVICLYRCRRKTSCRNQHAPETRLVVGIVVDQMRYDYLSRFKSKFGSGGFNRLVNEGFLCRNAQYSYVPTYTAPGHACVYTGTPPSLNGIVSNDWFDRNAGSIEYCVRDTTVQIVGATQGTGMSPKLMLSTTVTDELRKASGYRSKVIGIALKDRGAILPAGHQANGAFWHDPATGNWITSTFYMKELPTWLKTYNAKNVRTRSLQIPGRLCCR